MAAPHSIPLPNEYGYVLAVLGASFFMNLFLTVNVVRARSKYGIKYPALYAPPGHKFESEFNSVQRAHQNTLESYAVVMLMMCVVGLIHPITAAALGGVWVLGRVVYGIGYSTAGPSGRIVGALLSNVGHWPLVIISLMVGYEMVMA